MIAKPVHIITVTKEDTSTDNSIETLRQLAFGTAKAAEVAFDQWCVGVRAEANDSGFEDFEERTHHGILLEPDSTSFEQVAYFKTESESACIRYCVAWNKTQLVTEENAEEKPLPDTLYVQVFAMGIAGGVEIVNEDGIYKDANNDFAFDMSARQNVGTKKFAWKTPNGGIGLRLLATDGEYYTVYSDFRDTFSAPVNE